MIFLYTPEQQKYMEIKLMTELRQHDYCQIRIFVSILLRKISKSEKMKRVCSI